MVRRGERGEGHSSRCRCGDRGGEGRAKLPQGNPLPGIDPLAAQSQLLGQPGDRHRLIVVALDPTYLRRLARGAVPLSLPLAERMAGLYKVKMNDLVRVGVEAQNQKSRWGQDPYRLF
jgi:hypothetical protein